VPTIHNNKLSMMSLTKLVLASWWIGSAEGFLALQVPRCALERGIVSLRMSDWSSFQAMDDDEEIIGNFDTTDYAVEDDDDESKAQVGAALEAPTIEHPAEPISVVAGSQLELSEETVLGVMQAAREELGTLFGYSAENRGEGKEGWKRSQEINYSYCSRSHTMWFHSPTVQESASLAESILSRWMVRVWSSASRGDSGIRARPSWNESVTI
jgi:hypothetical protein